MLEQELTLACGVRLTNRIAKASMTEGLARTDGRANERHERLYGRWSEGGAALLLTGNVMVDGRFLEKAGNVVLEDRTGLEELRALARAGTRGATQLWMQISHPGRQTPRFVAPRPLAPSEVEAVRLFGAFGRPRALRSKEIRDIVGRFAATAALAQEAGFTGVQIHGAHGYLVSQFLSPRTNLRSDEWGGPLENRARFLLEIVRAVRANVGRAFPLSVKLNSADFQRGGFTEDESMEVVRGLEQEGVDLLEISGGNYESFALFGIDGSQASSTRAREAYFLDHARRVRRVTGLPLMVTGGFRSRAVMEEALATGALDVVGLARPLALDPDLPRKLLGGKAERSGAGPIRLGWRKLDALAEAGFYGRQLERMADGLAPEPRLSRLGSALRSLVSDITKAVRWRRALRRRLLSSRP
jgi:2,4-dienoyl-CoA reductase-like NADH-dependent reductase (Old Yellow Enzyme family)